MLTEENLSHWITSKASEEITRIKNHETKVQPHKHDSRLSVIDSRDRAKHFEPKVSFRNELISVNYETTDTTKVRKINNSIIQLWKIN